MGKQVCFVKFFRQKSQGLLICTRTHNRGCERIREPNIKKITSICLALLTLMLYRGGVIAAGNCPNGLQGFVKCKIYDSLFYFSVKFFITS